MLFIDKKYDYVKLTKVIRLFLRKGQCKEKKSDKTFVTLYNHTKPTNTSIMAM